MSDNNTLRLKKKLVLVNGFFSDDILFFYGEGMDKYSIFRYGLEKGLTNSELCIYGFYHTTVLPHFKNDIANGTLKLFEMRNNINDLFRMVEDCCEMVVESRSIMALRFLFDFSKVRELDEVLRLKNLINEKRNNSFPISGIYAFNMKSLMVDDIKEISSGIPRVIMLSDEENVISFPMSREMHNDNNRSIDVIDHEIVEDVVRKSLEPLILTLLTRPMSGLDIVKEIQNRFDVMLPMARIYSYLYELENEGILTVKKDGNKKIYTPTREGQLLISRKMEDITLIYSHILGGDGEGYCS